MERKQKKVTPIKRDISSKQNIGQVNEILKKRIIDLRDKTLSYRINLAAANLLKFNSKMDDDGYCDFFVENTPDGPWHEACGPDNKFNSLENVNLSYLIRSSQSRLAYIKKIRNLNNDAGYCDFFVENTPDGPWHEQCPDKNFSKLVKDPLARVNALRKTNVMKAFQNMMEI